MKDYIFLNIMVCAFLALFSFSASASDEKSSLTIDDLAHAELEYNYQSFKSSTASLQILNTYNTARIEHQRDLMSIEKNAYFVQQIMTVLIFFVVTALVLGGLWLSYIQFQIDVSKSSSPDEAQSKATFKIGKAGIEFSSSVIGLIVLFMSFFFFHLYVEDVYTIKTNKIEPLQFNSESSDNVQPEDKG